MLSCKECRREIEFAGRGAALPVQTSAHLDVCVACRAFQTERASLRCLIGTLEPVGAPPDFEFRLRARMAAQQRPAARFALPHFAPRTLAIASATCLVLVFAATYRWHEQQSVSGDAPMTAQGNKTTAPPATIQPKPVESVGIDNANLSPADKNSNPQDVRAVAQAQRHALPVERGIVAGLRARKAARGAVDVNDLGVNGVTAVTEIATLNPAVVPSMPVSVAASAKPLQILFKDTQGTARMISVAPVAFGARDLLGGRGTAARVNAAADQGVW